MNRRITLITTLLLCCMGMAAASDAAEREPTPTPPTPEVRFRPMTIELEIRGEPVAAYQVELRVVSGNATVVGVEGGAATGFTAPPYYDPAALSGGRIIIAAFNPQVSLPPGRHKVAVVHLRESGPTPTYEMSVITAGDRAGHRVEITATLLDDTSRAVGEDT